MSKKSEFDKEMESLRKGARNMDIKQMMKMMDNVNEIILSEKRYYDTVNFAGGIVDVTGELAKAWKILLVTVGEVKGEEHLKMRLHQDGIVALKKKGLTGFTAKEIFEEGLKVSIEKLNYAVQLGSKIAEKNKGGAV
jgi:hypothetical protein